MSDRVVHEVLFQHAEEAAFQWLMRDSAVGEPHYSLQDLAELDDKVEAHLDGLRIAGDEGWRTVQEQLAWEEAGEVFTAMALALESGDAARIEEAVVAGVASPELARGLASALAWVDDAHASPTIDALRTAEEPMRRRVALSAATVRRQLDDKATLEALQDADPLVRARALHAVGEIGAPKYTPYCERELESADPAILYAAAWSATLLGSAHGIPVLQKIAVENGPRAERACDLAARRMKPGDALAWQKDLRALQGAPRLAIVAARAIGDPALVPWLLEVMAVDELARPAGEAFHHITGVDLAYDDLEGEWPEGFEAGPTEDLEDENVDLDADEDLPWPAPALIAAWWQENGSRFPAGTRHLCGRPIEAGSLTEILSSGMQRQRAAAALELAALQPGQPLFEVRARGDRQVAALGAS